MQHEYADFEASTDGELDAGGEAITVTAGTDVEGDVDEPELTSNRLASRGLERPEVNTDGRISPIGTVNAIDISKPHRLRDQPATNKSIKGKSPPLPKDPLKAKPSGKLSSFFLGGKKSLSDRNASSISALSPASLVRNLDIAGAFDTDTSDLDLVSSSYDLDHEFERESPTINQNQI